MQKCFWRPLVSKKKKWETSCLPLLSGPFLPFVSIIPVLPNFDASSRSPFSVWSHILQEHIVWLSSTVYGGWISPATSSLATYPLPSPSIGLGKILPSSAIDFKLAHHGFQGITLGFWGIFLFWGTLPCAFLCILLYRLWNLTSVAVGGLSQPVSILQFIEPLVI